MKAVARPQAVLLGLRAVVDVAPYRHGLRVSARLEGSGPAGHAEAIDFTLRAPADLRLVVRLGASHAELANVPSLLRLSGAHAGQGSTSGNAGNRQPTRVSAITEVPCDSAPIP